MSRVTPGVVAERESAWILKGPRTFCLKRTRGADFWGCLGSEGKGEVSRVGGSAMTGSDHSLQWGGDGGRLRRGGSADEEQTRQGGSELDSGAHMETQCSPNLSRHRNPLGTRYNLD